MNNALCHQNEKKKKRKIMLWKLSLYDLYNRLSAASGSRNMVRVSNSIIQAPPYTLVDIRDEQISI